MGERGAGGLHEGVVHAKHDRVVGRLVYLPLVLLLLLIISIIVLLITILNIITIIIITCETARPAPVTITRQVRTQRDRETERP